MKHLNITVRGRVQGVSFRASTTEQAEQLGLQGWVCNQRDGSVYLEAEGEADALEALLEWLQQGPPAAEVERVDSESGMVAGFKGFHIR